MRRLISVGGCGYRGLPETAIYEVKHDPLVIEEFDNLELAKQFYDSLDVPKALWLSNGLPKLIDNHEYVDS